MVIQSHPIDAGMSLSLLGCDVRCPSRKSKVNAGAQFTNCIKRKELAQTQASRLWEFNM